MAERGKQTAAENELMHRTTLPCYSFNASKYRKTIYSNSFAPATIILIKPELFKYRSFLHRARFRPKATPALVFPNESMSELEIELELFNLGKHDEAEPHFRQAAQSYQNRYHGKEHADTLSSKNWLAMTLYNLKKIQRGRRDVPKVVSGRERVLGKEHVDTLNSKTWQKISSRRYPPTAKQPPDSLEVYFKANGSDRVSYTDTDIIEISRLLKLKNSRWSTIPRTYIVLRNIRCLDMFDSLIDLGFSDYFFPVTRESLPCCLRPSQRSDFLKGQKLIMTQSMDIERGQHCSFQQGDSLPFETQNILGAGSSGHVDEVISLISYKTYARKRIPRRKTNTGRTPEAMRQFVVEIQTLKRLEHNHVVEFVGSYTDRNYIGLIMSPVAEMDLSAYLDRANGGSHGELRTFFGCLAKALEYLHENRVRHKDIKPQNILVDRGRVLLTDFGLAFDPTNADGSATFNTVIGFTPRYCAPEVAMMDSRNTSSDIWSPGVVFLEMIAVLKGMAVKDNYVRVFQDAWIPPRIRSHESYRLVEVLYRADRNGKVVG
ncbi:hypothetical protein CIB48_g3014 [Xylaria polymorpha]|nr:hypothetical protein CIB48_g3014 [Xylaria polymorpha]